MLDVEDNIVLEVRNLSIAFRQYEGFLQQVTLPVINDLSVTVREGEILAIVGASGSGKSLLADSVLGLLPDNAIMGGTIRFRGEETDKARLKDLRGTEIALLPQSVLAFDPLMRVGPQARGARPTKEVAQKQSRVFQELELPEETERLFPFQLSGGMARRVLFSTAVTSGADLVIADEPTPGMQVDQAISALSLLKELASKGTAVMLITHDIDLAIRFADRVGVFYAGTVVEVARAEDFEVGPEALRHPYSRALWRALPQNDFEATPGSQPYPGYTGCPFAPRCWLRTAECEQSMPPDREWRGGMVRCFHAS